MLIDYIRFTSVIKGKEKHKVMKNFAISKETAVGFYEEAEALGLATKAHRTECISREHTCPTGKDVYLTYEKATKALRMRTNRVRSKEVYKCHVCGHFHLTSKDGEGRRPRAYSRSRERVFENQTRLMLEDGQIMQKARTMKPEKMKRGYIISMNRDVQFAYAN